MRIRRNVYHFCNHGITFCSWKHIDWNCPPWPGTVVTICMSCFMTGGPGKEYGTISLHQPEEFEKGHKEISHVWPPPRILLSGIHLGWIRCAHPGRTLSQNDWLRPTRKVIPSHKTRDCKPCDTAVLLGSLPLLYTYCFPPRCPFPIKSLALSAHVSPRTTHFWVLDKSLVSGPGRIPPSCNNSKCCPFNSLYACMLNLLSHVQLSATLWTVAQQAPSGKKSGASCYALLQGIFLAQALNLHLLSPALAGRFFITSTTWETQPPI